VPGFEVSEVGPVQAFGEQVEHKLALALGGYCEAAAIDRDTLPNPHSCGRAGAFDQELHNAVGAAQPNNLTNFAYQTRKHD
jgi:hypothetical protein